MAVPAAVLSILVQANTGGATRGLMRFNSQLGATEAKSNRALGAVKTLAKGSAVATGIGLGYAVKKAADFEQQLDSLGSVSGATGRQMEQFRKQAMKAGADTKFSALDAAEAQTELAKGGLKVRQIMRGGLKSALALAAAGEMELGEAAATTANALNLFGLEGEKSMKVADALAKAANATTADVTDFAMALRQSGGVAKTAGLSFTETVLALEALANAGTKNSDAGTSLKTALLQLIGPTAKQQKLQDKLGLSFIDSSGGMKSMTDISKMLRSSLDGMGAAQRAATLKVLAGTDGVRTLTALYDAGPEKLDKWRKGLQQSGTAADVAAQKQDNLKGKLENLQGSVETIAIGLGSKLLPGLTRFAEKTTKILNSDMTGGEKFSRFMEMVTQAVTKAIPVIADAGVKVAGALASGLARGWREMNPLMKLFTAAAVIRLVGGRGALLKSGVAIGTTIGAGVSAGAAGAAAGGAGAAGAAAAGGGMIAAMRAKVLPVAKRLGLAGVGIALADVVISEFGRRSAAKGSDMFAALKAQMGPKAGGLDLFGGETKILGVKGPNLLGDVMLKDSEKAARSLLPALEAIQKAQKGIGHERAEALRKEIGRLDDATPQARRALRDLVGEFERTGQKAKAVDSAIERMKTGSSKSIASLRTNVRFNTRAIRQALGEDTAAGRKAMTENFRAAISNVRRSMREGTVTTKQGTAEIERLMVAALQNMGFTKAQALKVRKGQDPVSGKAIGGRQNLTGRQRGGPIEMGAPSGDSVPAMLERGEYVMNRNAVRKVGRKALDNINFNKAPRFAKGGSVGIQNMVAAANQFERAGFPYEWGGGHEATPAPFGPVDCSGAVSYVLQHGGVQIPTMVSGAMTGIGKPGKGAVTVYADAGHVLMSIMGRFFGTSDTNPGGGAGWIDPAPSAAYLAAKTARHFGAGDVGAGFPGMGGAPNLPKVLVSGPDSLLKANVQGAISTTHAAAQEKLNDIAAQAAVPIGAGDSGTHTGSWAGGSTRAFAQRLASKVGLSLGSGYRSPSHNAAVGGATNSMHTHGTPANPGAWDVPVSAYGPDAAKGDKLAALGRAARLAEVIWKAPDHYDHVHLGFFQKGGLVEKLMGMAKGGTVGRWGKDIQAKELPSFYKAVWNQAKKLGKFKGSAPDLVRGKLFNKGAWGEFDPGKDAIHLAKPTLKALGDVANPSHGYAMQLLLHEMAHSQQKAGLTAYEREGGADLWAGWAGPQIFPKLGIGPSSTQPYGYPAWANKLAAEVQPLWWQTRQFGTGKGAAGAAGAPDGLADLNRRFPKHGLANKQGKFRMSERGVRAVAENAGFSPGLAMQMAQIAHGESDFYPGIVGNDPGGSHGWGLTQITPEVQGALGKSWINAEGGVANMLNPVANLKVAKKFYDNGGFSPWYGTRYLNRNLDTSSVESVLGGRSIGAGGKGGGKPKVPPLTDREKKQLKTPLKGSLGKVLTKTLKVLRSNKPAKFRGTRLTQLEKRIKGMGVGLPDGMKKQIADLRAGIELTGGNADAASSFNVDNEDGTTSLGAIRGKTEAGWVTDQLDMLFRLRNKLVDAKKILEKHRAEIQKAIDQMQKRLQTLAENIRTAAKAKREAEQHLKQLQKHPKRNRDAIKRQKAVIERIEGNQADRVRERDAISDKILPALTGKRKQFTTYINEHIMGSDGLPQIQGLGSPLEKMSALPPVGVFLGDIFDAQMRLRELAAPATSITDSSDSGTSESAELLKQLLDEANLRTAVSQKQYEVLRNMPPYGGQFATGGVVPGPIGAARTIVAHGGETVTPPGNSAPVVQLNFSSGMEWLDKYIEVKVDGVTRKQARAGARGLPGRGGGF